MKTDLHIFNTVLAALIFKKSHVATKHYTILVKK